MEMCNIIDTVTILKNIVLRQATIYYFMSLKYF